MTVSKRLLEGSVEIQVLQAIEQARKEAGPHADPETLRRALARAMSELVEREGAKWLRDAAALPPVRIPYYKSGL
jgi:hypothetical protein